MINELNLDFQEIFQGLPVRHLIMTPDLIMVAATNLYFEITHTTPEIILSKYVFDVFPESPATKQASGGSNLSSSLHQVIETKLPHTLPVQRYDFPLPPSHGGGFAARWWRITNSPILNSDKKLIYIVNTVEDVSHLVEVLENAQSTIKPSP